MTKTQEAEGPGYVCKVCGGPAPLGVGFVDETPGARARSEAVGVCPCGHSGKVDQVAELLPADWYAMHPSAQAAYYNQARAAADAARN